jgi:hypothetical protein
MVERKMQTRRQFQDYLDILMEIFRSKAPIVGFYLNGWKVAATDFTDKMGGSLMFLGYAC